VPETGGLVPGWQRSGGGTPTLQRVIESFASQLGSSYDTTTGIVGAQANAFARAICYDGWFLNERLANQWDALRMTDFVARWEKIYALTPSPTDSLTVRRQRIAVAQARTGYGNFQAVNDALSALLGPLYVTIINTASGSASVFTPAGWPVGSVDPTGQLDWYSTVAYLAIQVQQPSNWTDSDFYPALGAANVLLDGILPAWVTWSFIRRDVSGSTRVGFWLDEGKNLDNEAFA
jgi:hypothetical protein